jgi:hypothetical protein
MLLLFRRTLVNEDNNCTVQESEHFMGVVTDMPLGFSHGFSPFPSRVPLLAYGSASAWRRLAWFASSWVISSV